MSDGACADEAAAGRTALHWSTRPGKCSLDGRPTGTQTDRPACVAQVAARPKCLPECNVMSMWSLRWHLTNKSVAGAPYSIKGYSYSLSHSRTLWWRVRWLKQCRLEVVAELQKLLTTGRQANGEQERCRRDKVPWRMHRRLPRPSHSVIRIKLNQFVLKVSHIINNKVY